MQQASQPEVLDLPSTSVVHTSNMLQQYAAQQPYCCSMLKYCYMLQLTTTLAGWRDLVRISIADLRLAAWKCSTPMRPNLTPMHPILHQCTQSYTNAPNLTPMHPILHQCTHTAAHCTHLSSLHTSQLTAHSLEFPLHTSQLTAHVSATSDDTKCFHANPLLDSGICQPKYPIK